MSNKFWDFEADEQSDAESERQIAELESLRKQLGGFVGWEIDWRRNPKLLAETIVHLKKRLAEQTSKPRNPLTEPIYPDKLSAKPKRDPALTAPIWDIPVNETRSKSGTRIQETG